MNYIYHVFSSKKTSVYEFERYPIILSIATLRNFDQESPIAVIDRTPQFHDWEDFPKRFKFEVVKNTKKKIKDLPLLQNRLFDIKNLLPYIGEDVTYVDSDVFWLEKFSPQIVNDQISLKIKKNKYWYANSGFFYFKKNTLGHEYFNIWEDTLSNWKTQKNLLCFLNDFYGSNSTSNIGDEGIMGFLINELGWLDKINPCLEPALTGGQIQESPKLIHILSHTTTKKIQAAFRVKEINNIIRKNLNKKDIQKFSCDTKFKGDLNLKDFINNNVQLFKKTQKNFSHRTTKIGNENSVENDIARHKIFFL